MILECPVCRQSSLFANQTALTNALRELSALAVFPCPQRPCPFKGASR